MFLLFCVCFRNFELVLISGAAQGNLSGTTKYVQNLQIDCAGCHRIVIFSNFLKLFNWY